MSIHYQRIEPKHAAAFRTLRLESLQRYPDHYTSTYSVEVARDDAWYAQHVSEHLIFGAWDDGQLVATCRFTTDPNPRSGHKAHMSAVYVVPSHQRRGIARSLLQHCIAAIATDYEQILLAVDSGNAGALSLYSSLGFERYGYERRALKLDDGYLDDILMVKFLTDH